jgi:hypothetical protein
MKFRVTMKTPDALNDAIKEAIETVEIPYLDSEAADMVREKQVEMYKAMCARWFKGGDYLTVEIDTGAQTCTVVPVER